MKIYDGLQQFKKDYFNHNAYGFDEFAICHITHTSSDQYQELHTNGQDRLGYKPTLITVANPISLQAHDVIVKNVPDAEVENFKDAYSTRFIKQFDKRFGLFAPTKKKGTVLYDNFEFFSRDWLQTPDGKDVIHFNLPLLFDHATDAEYWALQQKDGDVIGTQRLIITIFQYRKNTFHDLFIKDVTDADIEHIKLRYKSKLNLLGGEVF